MKHFFKVRISFSIFFLLATCLLGIAQTTVYNVDVASSSIAWVGEKVVGSSHNGNLKIKSGELTLKKGKVVSAKIVADMNKITCLDIESEEWNGKFIKHITSDDFFSSSTYPEAVFVLSKIEKKGYVNQVSGTLTIKDVSLPISFPAAITYGENSASIVVNKLKIDRTKYGIKTMSSSFFDNLKDRAISDEFTIDIMLNASK